MADPTDTPTEAQPTPTALTVEGGKYTFIVQDGHVFIHRHGDPWLEVEEGSKALIALLGEHQQLMEQCISSPEWAARAWAEAQVVRPEDTLVLRVPRSAVDTFLRHLRAREAQGMAIGRRVLLTTDVQVDVVPGRLLEDLVADWEQGGPERSLGRLERAVRRALEREVGGASLAGVAALVRVLDAAADVLGDPQQRNEVERQMGEGHGTLDTLVRLVAEAQATMGTAASSALPRWVDLDPVSAPAGDYELGREHGGRARFDRCKEDIARALNQPTGPALASWEALVASVREVVQRQHVDPVAVACEVAEEYRRQHGGGGEYCQGVADVVQALEARQAAAATVQMMRHRSAQERAIRAWFTPDSPTYHHQDAARQLLPRLLVEHASSIVVDGVVVKDRSGPYWVAATSPMGGTPAWAVGNGDHEVLHTHDQQLAHRVRALLNGDTPHPSDPWYERSYEQQVLAACTALGFGRVMQVAEEAWAEADPVGALTGGPAQGTLDRRGFRTCSDLVDAWDRQQRVATGRMGYRDGLARDACPYGGDPDAVAAWTEGWNEAAQLVQVVQAGSQHVVLPRREVALLQRDAQRWGTVRGEVLRLDAQARPSVDGVTMADDDVEPLVLGALRQVARQDARLATQARQLAEQLVEQELAGEMKHDGDGAYAVGLCVLARLEQEGLLHLGGAQLERLRWRPTPTADWRGHPTAQPCVACAGLGWMIFQRSDGIYAVERCDTCKVFTTDEAAADAARTWVRQHLHADSVDGTDRPPARYTQGGRETIDVQRDRCWVVAEELAEQLWSTAGLAASGLVQQLADALFACHCEITADKYEARDGHKGDREGDERKVRFYRLMAMHVRGAGPDPRHLRPGFQPYVRQPWVGARG